MKARLSIVIAVLLVWPAAARQPKQLALESSTGLRLVEVRGDRARLFVHGRQQPTLIVNDVKSGASATGGVARWIDHGTIAHFRNLVLTP